MKDWVCNMYVCIQAGIDIDTGLNLCALPHRIQNIPIFTYATYADKLNSMYNPGIDF